MEKENGISIVMTNVGDWNVDFFTMNDYLLVSNTELKEKVEFYRQRPRESLKAQMAKAADEAHSGRVGKPPGYSDREELPFR